MRKRLGIILMLILMICSLIGCSKEEKEVVSEKVRTVKVKKVEQKENPVTLDYIGTVDSKEIVKYSFKSPGKIGKVYVEKGQKVKKGDKLAQLDIKDLNYAANAARATMETANLDIQKAKDSLKYAQDYFEKVEKLYNKEIISMDDYDKAKLNVDTLQRTHNQAISTFEKAKTDYDYKTSMLNDSTIYANQNGIIVDTLYKEGELAPQGYPVVVVRSTIQIVNVGISQNDLDKVKIGTSALIDVQNSSVKGKITNISEAPDSDTRTYNAEVEVVGDNLRLGSIAKIKFEIGSENGIWVPISSVMANGVDYVYIIKDSRAMKRTIELQNVSGSNVKVKGINKGDLLVIEGMKNIKNGYKVSIKK